ncbi:sensor histidine kinase [Hyalangium rubrum]|uniref:histidine kinase n=1 Tax=Hyalangium rubrum TaxID=3103134 RepID=A0ABU5H7X0_9BACT|nr:HAMP domain-containing sensor histidine kinase [Hyalangium sp. s54d21]MDY7229406.1 HAMP domain-containing sensor histidine kinase [Hyalangium sp. s54d21]
MREFSEEELKQLRLGQFLQYMLPIAVGFMLTYAAFALVLRSVALTGGAGAILVYTVALARARRLAARGQGERAAILTGYALLAMVLIGSLFVHFLLVALLMMPLAGVALLLPYLERSALARYMLAAFLVDVWVTVVDGLLPPLVEQPPLLLQRTVFALAAVACVGLTLRMLWVDAVRLRQSLARAEEAVATRDEFLSVASHELKTPLTPLNIKLHTLRRELSAPSSTFSPERSLGHLDMAQRQVKKLAELVEDLLDVSRIGAGKLELYPTQVDLATLVQDVVRRFEPEAVRVGSALELESDQPVSGSVDPKRFEQVLDNLLSNALKYGAGKPVRVRLEALGAQARLTVRDEGIGIATEALERIFRRFERAVSGRNYGGLGLGLYITRQIVEASGGTVRAISAPGQGATFTVELPLEVSAPPPGPEHRAAPG